MEVSGSFLSNTIPPKEAVKIFDNSVVDYIHVDIMDGKFVDNKTYTVSEVTKLSELTTKKLDIHLMVKNPEKYVDELSMLNTKYITFHYEAVKNHIDIINRIKNNGLEVGIAINPETSPKDIFSLIKYLDLIIIMSVHPGKSGQTFLNSVLYKIDVLKKYITDNNLKTKISIDGGVNETNIDILKEKKVDILVSSSYLLSGDINNKVKYIKGY